MTAPEREKCHKIACPHRPAWKAAHHCPHCDGSAAAAFCICETASADEIREAFGAEPKTFSPTFLETDVKSCARCGNDHPELRFVPFVFDAPPDASHWATCPQMKEPILLSIESINWPGERCKRCGRRNNIGFSVSDETWAAVVRERWNVLCPACFDEEAEAAGIAYRFADPAAVSWSDWRDDDEPIRCGTFSEESLSRKPEQQAPAHVRAFGRSLRALREDFGLTLGDLADILGARVSRVSDVERGIQREASTGGES